MSAFRQFLTFTCSQTIVHLRPRATVSDYKQVKKFDAIRDDVHGRYPALAELVDERFPEDSRGADAFKYALELYLRSIPNLEVALDGFTLLEVTEETPTALQAVGISYVLPSCQLPISAELHIVDGSIEYRMLLGLDDQAWGALTESKRWKAVYLYATEGHEPAWNWALPIEGSLA